MDRATGLPAEAIAVLYQTLVHNYPRPPRTTGRPPALSQAEEIRAAPTHLRRNRAQAEPAESFGAGRASTCRAIRRWTTRPVEVLAGLVPAADDPDQARTLIVDGTPVPCRDRKHEPGRTSRTPAPRPEDPYGCPPRPPGSPHDARAPQLTGLLDNPPDTPPLGDEGRIGPGMTTPIRRPAGGEPVDRQKQHTKIINSSRAPIERATAQ